jgi:uncharacterized protein
MNERNTMNENNHGQPAWYELGTTNLDGAGEFYKSVLGWSVADAGMDGFTYHLATAGDGGMVAGMMSTAEQKESPPPNWVVYFTCTNCDASAESIRNSGGQVMTEPADIPGTGRFAIVADPQGAVFGILQPEPMDDGTSGRAFDQQAPGHGNWHELMTTDPAAALEFYSAQFGWAKGDSMDMDAMGTYQMFRFKDADIGGMMGLGNAPMPLWLTYFGVDGVQDAAARIETGGGAIQQGPMEVPGGIHVAVATDPQGAWFAVAGPLTKA